MIISRDIVIISRDLVIISRDLVIISRDLVIISRYLVISIVRGKHHVPVHGVPSTAIIYQITLDTMLKHP